MQIGIKEQRVLKGIAIIGMMMLHFWGYPEWITPENGLVSILPVNLYVALGKFGNVCVSIFAIISGYSFFIVSEKWDSLKYRMKKLVSFLAEYWVYVALFLLVGFLMKDIMPSPLQLLLSLFGIEVSIEASYVCVPFAWYVSFYITTLLLYPIIKRIWGGTLQSDILFSLITYCLLKILRCLTRDYYGIGFFFFRENTLIMVILGFCLAKYDVFQRLGEQRTGNKKSFILLNISTIIILAILKVTCNDYLEDWWGGIYTIYIIYFVLRGYLQKVKIIEILLEILGRYSMGMWFVSGIFYQNEILQKLAFFAKRPILVLVWVTTLSFMVSFIFTNVFNIIEKYLINRNRNTHFE